MNMSGFTLALVAFVMHMAVISDPRSELDMSMFFGGENCNWIMRSRVTRTHHKQA